MTPRTPDVDDFGIQPSTTTLAHLHSATSLVVQLNEQTVGWLATVPANQPGSVGGWLPRELAPQARARLVQFPITLANVHFEDGEWWRRACLQGRAATDGREGSSEEARTAGLMRELLTLAWYMARTPQMPRFLMGMAPDVARILAGLSMLDLEDIASQQVHHLRPRWADAPGFWSELLAAAADPDEERWSKVQLHALQLLGRDLLSHGVHLPSSRHRRAPI